MPDYLAAATKTTNPRSKVRFSILGCQSCDLHTTRTKAVPWSGPPSSPIALMGEAPGAGEDKAGKPFVGQAGRLLDRCLTDAGLDRDSIMVFNSVCCRPPKNRAPTVEEQNACRPNLNAQLSLSKATVIVLLGGAAIATVTGETNPKVSEHQGNPFWASGRIWLPTYHPAYILRNRDMRYALIRDLTYAREIVEGMRAWPAVPVSEVGVWLDDADEATRTQLEKKGWVVVFSKILESTLVVVRDSSVRVSRKWAKYPRYTFTELAIIGGMKHLQELRTYHFVKERLGGTFLTAKVG